jgi:hypothetical protein
MRGSAATEYAQNVARLEITAGGEYLSVLLLIKITSPVLYL